ncbi:MAG: single-stranded DNA-binding protein [Candidatus Staskawiczbacteria bacterium]|nr:single-stranded DNA-binding protein [Candidatus Staskawiczbacteria bacterium]
MNLNKVFVLGNVTKDPEARSMPNGNQVTSFSIATNRFYTANGEKKQEAEFHNIVCFGKLADISSRYLTKGSLVLIEGRIKTRSWDDKSTGAKRWKTEIIAETMQLGPRGAGAPSASGNSSSYGKSYSKPEPEQDMSSNKQDEIPVIEENYTPPANDTGADSKTVSFEDNAADEIDVKDIPF